MERNDELQKPPMSIRRRRIRRTQRQAVIDGMKALSFQADDCDLAVHTLHVFAVDQAAAVSFETARGSINVTMQPHLAQQLSEALARLFQPQSKRRVKNQ